MNDIIVDHILVHKKLRQSIKSMPFYYNDIKLN